MPPRVGLNCTVSLWGYWLPPRGEIGFLLMDILVYSSLPPCVELLYPYEELHFLTRFRRYDRDFYVFFFHGVLVAMFLCLLDCATFLSSSGLLLLEGFILVMPMLRSEFVADVTVGLRDSQKLVVTFSSYSFSLSL